MPDSRCFEINRVSEELQQIFASTRSGGDSKKDRSSPKKFDLSVLQDKVHRDLRFKKQSVTPKKSRGKETSKHFGVRFRHDLHKWVAEIRVAEWKSVDKKVWLGTFDTEVGAARAVDAARMLLKCKKKRLPNCPCMELDAYSECIPSNLNLQHLEDDAMFKDVTLFIKRKAQEYAASFCTTATTTTPFSPEPSTELKMEFAIPCEMNTLPTTSSSRSSHSTSEDDVDHVPWNPHYCEVPCSSSFSEPTLINYTVELIDSTDETMHQPSWDDNTLFFNTAEELSLEPLWFDDPEHFLQPDFDCTTHEQAMHHLSSTDHEMQHYNDDDSLSISGTYPFQRASFNMVDHTTMEWSQSQFYPFKNSFTPVY